MNMMIMMTTMIMSTTRGRVHSTTSGTVLAAALAIAPVIGATASAAEVEVTITGEVEFNQIGGGLLGMVSAGDAAALSFTVDSDVFTDSRMFPTRGYHINEDSFTLALGPIEIGLQNPFPAGQTPFFTLRNDDPAVDGFFLSTDVDGPVGVPIDQEGVFEQFRSGFSVTYTGDTLDSLDLLDAAGTYDFSGLTVFNFTVLDGPFKPMGLIFADMTIADLGEPCPDIDESGAVDFGDLLAVLSVWGSCPGCPEDLDGDDNAGFSDLLIVLSAWGPCP